MGRGKSARFAIAADVLGARLENLLIIVGCLQSRESRVGSALTETSLLFIDFLSESSLLLRALLLRDQKRDLLQVVVVQVRELCLQGLEQVLRLFNRVVFKGDL